ncbi:dimethyl sulfoxide reductase anchor subunit family protein [Desulfitobacterium hafniense]|uniref:DMSO reductase n=4 Tax=root TaxID=1 RepID=A0A098B212_DESHA|nr:DmsC/YnfH family molybdoenzyme membrane anchor subunit [Desulfitobacterium hafniense]ACL21487.1 oxidoreductase anaerobic dimethyl sulfoxide reductase subunit C [Desulfitobacterium hafniense DCB-2]KTE89839.1 DMSO reductase [Desulfitobacterium hafniense]MEA5023179.1 DmsC/YnfH family molybdoenzyme membrane anchor subunit [Desulfitobacterium hafniense]CDX02407.1 Molybdopterin oxidoreductase subunit C [Desulfitobacterium hafniense]BAE84119.1 putative anaerobic DMSO reductase chain C anchor subun
MHNWEIPLVLFTVLTQWAVGIALILTVVEFFFAKLVAGGREKFLRPAGMMTLPLVGGGLLFSVFHLGQPWQAVTALSNLGTAALSLEVLLFALVALLALAYSYIWWKKADQAGVRKLAGLGVSVVGLAAVAVSSKVYMLPARPAWNSWTTPGAFLLTAVVLGTFTVLFCLGRSKDKEVAPGIKSFSMVAMAALAAGLLVLSGSGAMAGNSAEQAAVALGMFSSPVFYVRAILGVLVPAACVGLALQAEGRSALLGLGLAGVLVGEISGRILFYASTMALYPWF